MQNNRYATCKSKHFAFVFMCGRQFDVIERKREKSKPNMIKTDLSKIKVILISMHSFQFVRDLLRNESHINKKRDKYLFSHCISLLLVWSFEKKNARGRTIKLFETFLAIVSHQEWAYSIFGRFPVIWRNNIFFFSVVVDVVVPFNSIPFTIFGIWFNRNGKPAQESINKMAFFMFSDDWFRLLLMWFEIAWMYWLLFEILFDDFKIFTHSFKNWFWYLFCVPWLLLFFSPSSFLDYCWF